MVIDVGQFPTVHRSPTLPVCGSVSIVTFERPDPFPFLASGRGDNNHDIRWLVFLEIRNVVFRRHSDNPLELAVWFDLNLPGAGLCIFG